MHKIHLPAFIAALLIAPLIPGLPGLLVLLTGFILPLDISILLLVPTVGIALGAPTYLIFGTRVFLKEIRAQGRNAAGLWAHALKAHLWTCPVALVALFWKPDHPVLVVLVLIGLGCIHAPIWGALFGWLYRVFTNATLQEERHA